MFAVLASRDRETLRPFHPSSAISAFSGSNGLDFPHPLRRVQAVDASPHLSANETSVPRTCNLSISFSTSYPTAAER